MTDTVKATEDQILDKLKVVYNEIFNLEQDIKEIVDEAKAAGLDATGLKDVAKAIVYAKLTSLEKKCKDRLELIQRVA